MTIYLFDTSVFISNIHGNSTTATEYIRRVQSKEIAAAISVITYYEIWRGATEQQKLATKALLRPFTIHSLSKQIAIQAIELYKTLPNKNRKRVQLDLLIAATAEYTHAILVTCDNDFLGFTYKNCRVEVLPDNPSSA